MYNKTTDKFNTINSINEPSSEKYSVTFTPNTDNITTDYTITS